MLAVADREESSPFDRQIERLARVSQISLGTYTPNLQGFGAWTKQRL